MRDSSLSACTQAVIAAEVGHLGLAHDYLAEAALMDLDDLEHNTRDGLHVAALAGTWIALVAGFAGLRERGGTLGFAPRLPAGMTRLVITLSMRQRRLRIEITPDTTTYRLIDGEPLPILHDGQLGSVSTEIPLLRPTGKAPHLRSPPSPSVGSRCSVRLSCDQLRDHRAGSGATAVTAFIGPVVVRPRQSPCSARYASIQSDGTVSGTSVRTCRWPSTTSSRPAARSSGTDRARLCAR